MTQMSLLYNWNALDKKQLMNHNYLHKFWSKHPQPPSTYNNSFFFLLSLRKITHHFIENNKEENWHLIILTKTKLKSNNQAPKLHFFIIPHKVNIIILDYTSYTLKPCYRKQIK